jgi:hypothetical protein
MQERIMTREDGDRQRVDVQEFVEMARKLPDKEKELFFYMVKGAELVMTAVRTARST